MTRSSNNDDMVKDTTLAPPDRRRRKSRAALLAAGEGLFARHGVDAVSVDEIVAAADVAKGTFYNHFESKDDLSRAIASAIRAEVEEAVTSGNAEIADPALRSARALCVYARFAEKAPDRARVLTRIHAGAVKPGATLNRGVVADIERGLAENRFQARSLQAALLFVMGTVIAGMVAVLDGAAPEEIAAALAEMQLAGLGLPAPEAAALGTAAAASIFRETNA
ncbi:MAG: TetR family transcriptional regulator [Alphaproteobacteria bacterium]|nr:TetR family transcriptional regulator [Alphaproteobacteria bacterium]